MKLYHHDGVWQLPGQQDKKATKVEVPTGSAELAEFLNDRNVPAFPVFESESVAPSETAIAIDTSDIPETKEAWFKGATLREPTAEAIAKKVSQFKTDEIVDFILDHASVNQAANILSCLGTRVGELTKSLKGE